MKTKLLATCIMACSLFTIKYNYAQWSTNSGINNVVSTAMADQGYVYPPGSGVISDGNGGAIFTWHDNRSGNYHIYAQRINAAGIVQWTVDGTPICTAANSHYNPTIASDGSGGAIITWEDSRNAAGVYDIYAQRINAAGIVQWATNGIAICTAIENQPWPTIISDNNGGAVITWQDNRSLTSYDIYAQRIDSIGIVQWTADGVAICIAVNSQTTPNLISDGSGGTIITWSDYRNASVDIYAQRIDGAGLVQWTIDGVPVCNAVDTQSDSKIISDNNGGAIITWQDNRNLNSDIYVQLINGSGVVQWIIDGVGICTDINLQYKAKLISDDSGGAIICWEDYRNSNADIYAQQINASGIVQWTAGGVAICSDITNQFDPTITSDSSAGAIITWQDYRSGNPDIYAQRMNASGLEQWTINGVAISTAANNQFAPRIVSNGSQGAIITWNDYRSGTNNDIYAQRVNYDGNLCVDPLVSYTEAASFVCLTNGPFILTAGTPTGGIYSGNGVGGNSFNPFAAGLGTHNIIYSYTDSVTGCSNTDTSQITVDPCVGIEGSKINSITVFPNPGNGMITIHSGEEISAIEITDIQGRKITYHLISTTTEKSKIELLNVSTGTYFVLVNTMKGVYRTKIVVEK